MKNAHWTNKSGALSEILTSENIEIEKNEF